MGGGSSQPSSVTQTTKTEPPKWVQPYSTGLLSRASTLTQQPYQPYPYYNVAALQPEHYVGMNQITQRALGGAPTTEAGLGFLQNLMQSQADYGPAGDYLQRVIGGQYLTPESNPYLKDFYNSMAGRVTENYQNAVNPQVQAAAARAGAYGGSAHRLLEGQTAENLSQTLGDMANQFYSQAYGQERGYQMGAAELLANLANQYRENQLRAAAMTPMMEQAGYAPMNALMGVGDFYRQYEQQQLADYAQRWQEQQQWPYQQLSFMGNMIPMAIGNWGTSTTTGTNPNYNPSSTWGNVLGGAGMGIGTGLMASAIPGVGVPLAAGLGGLTFLSSLFS